jgi:hypothetical protein
LLVLFAAVAVVWTILELGWGWLVVIGEVVIIVGPMEYIGSLDEFIGSEGFSIGKLICRELLVVAILLVGCLVVIGVRLVGLLAVIVGELLLVMSVAVAVVWIIFEIGWDWLVVILGDEGFFSGRLICGELLGIILLLAGCLVVIRVRLVELLTVIVGE